MENQKHFHPEKELKNIYLVKFHKSKHLIKELLPKIKVETTQDGQTKVATKQYVRLQKPWNVVWSHLVLLALFKARSILQKNKNFIALSLILYQLTALLLSRIRCNMPNPKPYFWMNAQSWPLRFTKSKVRLI